MTDVAEAFDEDERPYAVGYRRPPLETRFMPGQSGNPAGRPKGSANLRTLIEKVLKEQIALREGNDTKTISKAEAIVRGLVIGALKGDSRSQMTFFRLAEQMGQLEQQPAPLQIIQRVIVDARTAHQPVSAAEAAEYER